MSDSVFITGANGFIGTHLSRSLQASGMEVFKSSVDILDTVSLGKELGEVRPAVVFHLAAVSHPSVCEQDPVRAEAVNVKGTENLLDAVSAVGGVSRFIFASTAQVYKPLGPEGGELSEESPLEPINFYASTKLRGESLVANFPARPGMEAVVVRIFNHVHKSQSSGTFLGSLYRSLLQVDARGGVVPVGNLDLYRDMGSIADLVGALRAVCVRKEALPDPLTVMNICNGRPRLLRDLAEGLASRMGKSVEFRPDESRMRPGEPKKIVGSHHLATRILGWRPSLVENEDLIEAFLQDSPIL